VQRELLQVVRAALADCLAVKAGESVAVVTDPILIEVGQAFWQGAVELGAEPVLLTMLPRENNGQEPPAAVAEALLQAQVVLLATSKSLSHTRARQEANRAGARVASLPGATPEMLVRTLNADYQAMAPLVARYAQLLTRGRRVRVTSPSGTDLVLELGDRQGHADDGIYHRPGSFGNLPAGEAYIAPLENTAEGVLVIDGSMAGLGLLEEPLVVTVKNGLATEVNGGSEAKKLTGILNRYGPAARNIAELGLGLNPGATLTGNTLEDEKIAASAHIALGDNSTFGGQVAVDSHLDGVILNPTVEIDGLAVMRDGELLAN